MKEQIIERDRNDMSRKHNPLMKADDAVEIDSTYMSVEDVACEIIEIVNKKIGR